MAAILSRPQCVKIGYAWIKSTVLERSYSILAKWVGTSLVATVRAAGVTYPTSLLGTILSGNEFAYHQQFRFRCLIQT